MSAPTWAKVVGVGALLAGAAGIAAVVMSESDGDDGGTIPPDEIEGEDELEEDDDELLVDEDETIPGVFEK